MSLSEMEAKIVSNMVCINYNHEFSAEAVVNYDFPKAYKLVHHDISLTCKYQGPHSPVKLPPFNKRVLSTINDHRSHVISKVGGAN